MDEDIYLTFRSPYREFAPDHISKFRTLHEYKAIYLPNSKNIDNVALKRILTAYPKGGKMYKSNSADKLGYEIDYKFKNGKLYLEGDFDKSDNEETNNT